MNHTKVRMCLVLVSLSMLLLAIIIVPHEPILNRFTAYKLHREGNPQRRIVIINTTLGYAPEYWNREYLREALRAGTQLERRFLADLIHERLNTNGVQQLKNLLTSGLPEVAITNVTAVISEVEGIRK